MDGTATRTRRSALRGIALAAALMLPASASGPAFADPGSSGRGAEFKASFAPLNAAASAFVPTAGMVDVTQIDPADEPVEAAAEDVGPGRSITGGVASYYGNELAGHRTASGGLVLAPSAAELWLEEDHGHQQASSGQARKERGDPDPVRGE